MFRFCFFGPVSWVLFPLLLRWLLIESIELSILNGRRVSAEANDDDDGAVDFEAAISHVALQLSGGVATDGNAGGGAVFSTLAFAFAATTAALCRTWLIPVVVGTESMAWTQPLLQA